MRLNNAIKPEDHKTILMLENLIANMRAGNIEIDHKAASTDNAADKFSVALVFKGNPHINVSIKE